MDAFGDGKEQVVEGWEWLQEFLPKKVSVYVEDTVDDGQKVLEDIYEETRNSIVEKTSVNVDDVTNLMETFIEKLEKIRTSSIDIGEILFKIFFFVLLIQSLNCEVVSVQSGWKSNIPTT